MCISTCHYGSMHGSVRVHMVYSARVKLAVRITARCADPRPFCPHTPAPGRSPDCYPRRIRPAGSLASCPRQAAGWPARRCGRADRLDRPAPYGLAVTAGGGPEAPPLGRETGTTWC
jgi:hypothetical protein